MDTNSSDWGARAPSSATGPHTRRIRQQAKRIHRDHQLATGRVRPTGGHPRRVRSPDLPLRTGWRHARAITGRLRLRLRRDLSRTAINSRPVPLVDNCVRNSVCQQLAILPVARLVALGSIAQESALHQNGRARCQPQDAKISRVPPTIGRVRDGHQLALDLIRQIERSARVIVSLESVDPAPARIIKMDADKDRFFLRILYTDSI